MTPENAFEEALRRDLQGHFWLENVEQRHERGYPDINFIDLKSDSIGLVELKVTYHPFDWYRLDAPVVIKSLKPHQINWLESRASVGGRDRRNIGMLLWVDPFIFYIKGKDVTHWRDNKPTIQEIFSLAGRVFYKNINPSIIRSYMFGTLPAYPAWSYPVADVMMAMKEGAQPKEINIDEVGL